MMLPDQKYTMTVGSDVVKNVEDVNGLAAFQYTDLERVGLNNCRASALSCWIAVILAPIHRIRNELRTSGLSLRY